MERIIGQGIREGGGASTPSPDAPVPAHLHKSPRTSPQTSLRSSTWKLSEPPSLRVFMAASLHSRSN